jgi:uncharacterized protein (DUF779 family)
MIEFAQQELSSNDVDRRRSMIRRMAEQWPDEPALSLVYAVTAATGQIEQHSSDPTRDASIPMGYRLSALISADVHAVQSMGQVPSVAGDLLHFWRRVDPSFLRLQ